MTTHDVPAAWLAVACAEHVRRGRASGFMQVCHGKSAPLRRLRPGHGIAYYSPTVVLATKHPYRALTACGLITERDPYPADMGNGFRPWRRDVRWWETEEIPIAPLLDRLVLTAGRRNWGYALRFGLVAISPEDFRVIAAAMRGA